MSIQILGLVHPFIRASCLFPIDVLLQPGNALVICGANGTGKTTLLRLLLNELQPKKGTIKTNEKITYLGVKNGLKLQLKVCQQLPYFMSNQQEFPWPEFLNKTYKDLSKGQQRLIALWLALHSSMQLILVDEPFMHLDNYNRSIALTWIAKQLHLKKTIIFSHHNLEDLKNIHPLHILDLNIL